MFCPICDTWEKANEQFIKYVVKKEKSVKDDMNYPQVDGITPSVVNTKKRDCENCTHYKPVERGEIKACELWTCEFEKKPVRIVNQLMEITEEICRNYCKYPDLWDEEAEGCELSESEHCRNCPLRQI